MPVARVPGAVTRSLRQSSCLGPVEAMAGVCGYLAGSTARLAVMGPRANPILVRLRAAIEGARIESRSLPDLVLEGPYASQ